MREGRLCAGDFPEAELPDTCPLLKPVNLSSAFIFPLPMKKMGEKQDCLFQKDLEPILQKRTLRKREKRTLCKSSEGFQNFPFLPIINMIFPFALSSPLWHSWYISFCYYSFKAPPPCRFVNPLDCSDGRGFFYFLEFGGLWIKELKGTGCNVY